MLDEQPIDILLMQVLPRWNAADARSFNRQDNDYRRLNSMTLI